MPWLRRRRPEAAEPAAPSTAATSRLRSASGESREAPRPADAGGSAIRRLALGGLIGTPPTVPLPRELTFGSPAPAGTVDAPSTGDVSSSVDASTDEPLLAGDSELGVGSSGSGLSPFVAPSA